MSQSFYSQEASDSPRSQASLAYAQIKRNIVAGRLAPGAKLKINEMAVSLAVSPGAIREALSRLAAETLVVGKDQKGFIVSPLSVADLRDLTELRCEIEALALRQSISSGGVDWEARVLAAAHRLTGSTRMLDAAGQSLNPEWLQRHESFHAALVSGCTNKRILALHTSLYEQSERYRGLSVRLEAKRDVAGEHRRIAEAVRSRDAQRTIDLAVGHIRKTTLIIVAAMERGTVG
ncbi:MAG TPA: FCD domain-containing protein [Steroidobacteraceae bacterium]|nr:FCD domain-containing protein [Steroidobacteraceae bacterium]